MIKCYDCKYFIDREKISDWNSFPTIVYREGVPDEIVERLCDQYLRCKAFPDGIPKEMFRRQNTDEDTRSQLCANGYSYFPGHYNEESDRYWEPRYQELHEMIDRYYCEGGDPMPGWQRYAKSFHSIGGFEGIRHNVENDLVIYRCHYKGHVYIFGIQLPEPVITDDMLQNGDWEVYTWND